MLSLKLLPVGSDTFRQTLTLLDCGTAKIEFDLKLGKGGDLKGPATNFLLTQEARTSVTAAPCCNAMVEFFTTQAGKEDN
jgi:hypothetical protein